MSPPSAKNRPALNESAGYSSQLAAGWGIYVGMQGKYYLTIVEAAVENQKVNKGEIRKYVRNQRLLSDFISSICVIFSLGMSRMFQLETSIGPWFFLYVFLKYVLFYSKDFGVGYR